MVFWREFFDFLTPSLICVVLPVLIVWFVLRARQHEIDKKTEIMLKAIDSGTAIDTGFFQSGKETKSVKEKLLSRLTAACILSLSGIAVLVIAIVLAIRIEIEEGVILLLLVGGILTAVGISLFIVYSVGKKMLAKEIEVEEKALEKPQE